MKPWATAALVLDAYAPINVHNANLEIQVQDSV